FRTCFALFPRSDGATRKLLSYAFVKPTFLIDTDTASDDAVALIMALRSTAVRVVAITTVAGNVVVQQATRNALYTAELCASNVPGFSGHQKPPSARPPPRALFPRPGWFGGSGLSGAPSCRRESARRRSNHRRDRSKSWSCPGDPRASH